MKRNIIVFLLLSLCFCVKAQTDSVQLQITYAVQFKGTSKTDTIHQKDIECLDIGRLTSHYYSLIDNWYKEHSTNTNPYVGHSLKFEVYKNMPKLGNITYIHMPGWITVIEKNDQLFNWNLVAGDSTICDYPCKKAFTDFRGRKWTVWYTLDIPNSDGPWKFCGLPGLVLKATDNDQNFDFTCIGINRAKAKKISYPSNAKHIVSAERADELQQLEQKDFTVYMNLLLAGQVVIREIKTQGNSRKNHPQMPSLELFK